MRIMSETHPSEIAKAQRAERESARVYDMDYDIRRDIGPDMQPYAAIASLTLDLLASSMNTGRNATTVGGH
jgi:hypothetical protein